jgi:hypothetical protein
LALSFVVSVTFAGATEVPSHCSKNETDVFSCKVRSSDKYVSLCGSKPLNGPRPYLVYRFGALGRTEMSYPTDTAGSLHQFRSSHYFRAQVDRRSISFSRSGVTYDLFSNFEGEASPPQREGGVIITMAGKKAGFKTLHCAKPYFEKLELLDGILQKAPDIDDDD